MSTLNIVIVITTKNSDEAHKIARALLEDKLIACANIMPGIQSVFWWEGKVDQAEETMMVLKSKRSLFKKIVKKVKSLHSYSVPEVIALPILDGNPDYLRWIDESVR